MNTVSTRVILISMLQNKVNVLIIGCGGIGTIAALDLEKSGQAAVTAVLRSNYKIVKDRGFNIKSIDHGEVFGFKPSTSTFLVKPRALILTC